MQKLILGAALALSLAFAATASAGQLRCLPAGRLNDQFGWKATGPYDQEVASVDGHQKLRISNAVTSGSFADMPYSAPVDPAGEQAANNVLDERVHVQVRDPG